MDFIKLFNEIAVVARPAHKGEIAILSLDEKFSDAGLDSLDMLLIGVYMADIYGIPEDIAKTMMPTTGNEMLEFIEKHKTQTPESIEEAVKMVK